MVQVVEWQLRGKTRRNQGKADLSRKVTLLKRPMLVSSVTRGNSLRHAAFRPVKPNWRESRTGKTTQLKLFARARELANSDLLMSNESYCPKKLQFDRATGSLLHSSLLPEVQGLISTSQGTKVGQELRLFCNAATSLL